MNPHVSDGVVGRGIVPADAGAGVIIEREVGIAALHRTGSSACREVGDVEARYIDVGCATHVQYDSDAISAMKLRACRLRGATSEVLPEDPSMGHSLFPEGGTGIPDPYRDFPARPNQSPEFGPFCPIR